jgi:hypothetical protein
MHDDPHAQWDYASRGYAMGRTPEDQNLVGEDGDGVEHNLFLPKGTIGVAVMHDDGRARWYFPQLTAPDSLVGDTGLTFEQVWCREGFDPLELLLPYTGRPDDEDEEESA